MLSIARDAQIVDISHTVRKFAIGDGAYLLRSARAVAAGRRARGGRRSGRRHDPAADRDRAARGDVLVGPDNGLLLPAAERLGGVTEARVLENRAWMLPETSSTFHGRDIFSPVGAHLAAGEPFEAVGSVVDPATWSASTSRRRQSSAAGWRPASPTWTPSATSGSPAGSRSWAGRSATSSRARG